MKEIDWEQIFIIMWDLLVEKLKECESRFVLQKVVEVNGVAKYKETFYIKIKQNIKKKPNLWKRYMETRSFLIYRNYRRMRNKVKNMIKYSRQQKEKQISVNTKKNL